MTTEENTWRLLCRPSREVMEYIIFENDRGMPKGLWDSEIRQNHFNLLSEILRKNHWLPSEWFTVKSDEILRKIHNEEIYHNFKRKL